jgi:hypothetical protein
MDSVRPKSLDTDLNEQKQPRSLRLPVAERRIITNWAVQFEPLAGRRAPSPRTPLPHLPRFAMDRDSQGLHRIRKR